MYICTDMNKYKERVFSKLFSIRLKIHKLFLILSVLNKQLKSWIIVFKSS